MESILVAVGFPPKKAMKDVHKKSKKFVKCIIPIIMDWSYQLNWRQKVYKNWISHFIWKNYVLYWDFGKNIEHHESATHRKMPPMIKSENFTHMKYYKESATQTKKESVTHMKFVKFLWGKCPP